MKTERRHELETNWLARQLARWIDQLKPYGKAVTGVLVAAVVVGTSVWFFSQQTSQTEAAAWDAYYLATEGGRPNLDELAKLAVEHAGTSVQQWAELARADSQLQIGTRLLFRDKQEAANLINQAIAEYEQIRKSVQSEPLRQRATFNLARAYEALGKLDDAIRTYQQVEGAFREMAQARLEVLEQKSSKQFYDWFAQAELPQPGVSETDPGTPGQAPPFRLDGPGAGDAAVQSPAPSGSEPPPPKHGDRAQEDAP